MKVLSELIVRQKGIVVCSLIPAVEFSKLRLDA